MTVPSGAVPGWDDMGLTPEMAVAWPAYVILSRDLADMADLGPAWSWWLLCRRPARACVAPALVDEVRLLVAVAVAGGWGASA